MNNSYSMSQRYDVAKRIFAFFYHALKCLDEKQERAVSGGVFVQISLRCTPHCRDSSSSCGVLIISRNQAINLLLSLVAFSGSPTPAPHPCHFFFNDDSNTTPSHTGCVVLDSLMAFEAF